MKIQNIKTTLQYEVSEADWEKMKQRGDSRKYIVISSGGSKLVAKPKEVENKEYDTILKNATKAFGNQKYQRAKELFEKAAAIKPSTFISEKLAEIQSILEKPE